MFLANELVHISNGSVRALRFAGSTPPANNTNKNVSSPQTKKTGRRNGYFHVEDQEDYYAFVRAAMRPLCSCLFFYSHCMGRARGVWQTMSVDIEFHTVAWGERVLKTLQVQVPVRRKQIVCAVVLRKKILIDDQAD